MNTQTFVDIIAGRVQSSSIKKLAKDSTLFDNIDKDRIRKELVKYLIKMVKKQPRLLYTPIQLGKLSTKKPSTMRIKSVRPVRNKLDNEQQMYQSYRIAYEVLLEKQFQGELKHNSTTISYREKLRPVPNSIVDELATKKYANRIIENASRREEAYQQYAKSYLVQNQDNIIFETLDSIIQIRQKYNGLDPLISNIIKEAYMALNESTMTLHPCLNRDNLADVFANYDRDAYLNKSPNYDHSVNLKFHDMRQLVYVAKGLDIPDFETTYISEILENPVVNDTFNKSIQYEYYAMYLLPKRAAELTLKLSSVVLLAGKKYTIGRLHENHWENVLYKDNALSLDKIAAAYKQEKTAQLEYLIPTFSAFTKMCVEPKQVELRVDRDGLISCTVLPSVNRTFIKRRSDEYFTLINSGTFELGHGDQISLIGIPGQSFINNGKIERLRYLDPQDLTYTVVGTKRVYVKHVEEPITFDKLKTFITNVLAMTKRDYNVLPTNVLIAYLEKIGPTHMGGGHTKSSAHSYKGKQYKIRIGKRGGKYIIANGKKRYLPYFGAHS